MWPFSKISRLEDKIHKLVSKNEALEREYIFNSDQKNELEFLRDAIKDYVVYRKEYCYYTDTGFRITRTLKDAEDDIAKLNLYVAVLESNLGEEKTESCKVMYDALMAIPKESEKS